MNVVSMYALPILLPISPCFNTKRSAICTITNASPWHLTMKRVPRGPSKNQLLHRLKRSISYHFNTQAKVIRLRPKMAPSLLPTSSSSKTGRAGSLYSFEDSYSRGGNGNGVEAYTLPKGERGLPLVLRRLGKFKSMVCPPSSWVFRRALR
jgi:hypothetical protein